MLIVLKCWWVKERKLQANNSISLWWDIMWATKSYSFISNNMSCQEAWRINFDVT